MQFGHTDGAAAVYSSSYGIIVVGGREVIAYINNKGERNPDYSMDSNIVEQFKDNRKGLVGFDLLFVSIICLISQKVD